ncbi:MAG: type II restriction endonuclease subunit M, partial [Gammaproteobacteria bacterium]
FDGLLPHDLQGVMIESPAVGKSFAFHGRYYRSPDTTYGKLSSYWVSAQIREGFKKFPAFETQDRTAKVGLATADDFRFLRSWFELGAQSSRKWVCFAKGGGFSQFYADIPLVLNWSSNGAELKETVIAQHGNAGKRVYNEEYYFRPGITWPLRAHRFSPQVLPSECIFSVRGYSVFVAKEKILSTIATLNSTAFDYIFKTALGRFGYPEFIVGALQKLPWVEPSGEKSTMLMNFARSAWSLKRSLDTVTETSHAFLLPLALRQALVERLGAFDPPAIETELARIQAQIDDIAFELYGFSDADRAAALGGTGGEASDEDAVEGGKSDEDEAADDTPSTDALLSWAIGVAFGRFDIRLATGEREAPPEPEPFDPLPAKSPGMLPDGDAPFHAQAGILVDDPGHAHDLVRIAERVLERVKMPVPAELRRWLQKDFFPFHLQRYSKSRRKAPIYWPLSTASGSYTLWLYYPSLTSQTLYTAINDFVEPTLAEVETEAATLRTKGSARSRDEEKRLEALSTLQAELRDLRDQLQAIAPQYQPNHDDGVQITAAPLWPLFRHKPWQKVLKDTWAKLEKGDYDWAHLAMTYWAQRVRDKCRHDRSLAIAHGLEELYEEPPVALKKARGRKNEKDISMKRGD